MSNVQAGLKYSKEHEWVRVDGNRAYVGITDFAQHELGDIVFVELPNEGHEFTINASFGTVESVKTVSDLFAPVSGKIVQVNVTLEGTPENVNTDPYGDGWMVVIEMDDPKELDGLLDSDSYAEFISK